MFLGVAVKTVDCLIIGAGAAGLFCAIHAAKRGRQVLVLDHANKPGKKILMSGGGRCNFTNLGVSPDNYLGQNPHFHKSALSQYTQWDFIDWVESHGIEYYEKTQGQLFCRGKARELLDALVMDCAEPTNPAEIRLKTSVQSVAHEDGKWFVKTELETIQAESLVVATGGLSIPTMGSSPFAYRLAEQFKIAVLPVRAGLVPFTLEPKDLQRFDGLSGVSLPVSIQTADAVFDDDLLFTHRGLSGPAVLQLSSYWQGQVVSMDWLPKQDVVAAIKAAKSQSGKLTVKNFLSKQLPNRLVLALLDEAILSLRLADLSSEQMDQVRDSVHQFQCKPSGTEGYRTAEVTLGGVDTDYLSSQTMQVKTMPSLYFIGEAVDVTGWLGGYNFQWAWSSAWVAAQTV